MIVFDTSTIVSATINPHTAPYLALQIARESDIIAMSSDLYREVREVLFRTRLTRFIDPVLRQDVLEALSASTVWFEPAVAVVECRDRKDDKVLELAFAAVASTIVSSDNDLLVLHPWRGCRIVQPIDYIAATFP